jgi:hypothetical protein
MDNMPMGGQTRAVPPGRPFQPPMPQNLSEQMLSMTGERGNRMTDQEAQIAGQITKIVNDPNSSPEEIRAALRAAEDLERMLSQRQDFSARQPNQTRAVLPGIRR